MKYIDNTNGSSTVEILPSGITQPNLVSNYSIGYSSVPGEITEIEHAVTIHDIIEDVSMSYGLGWITKESVKKILIVKLEAAQKLQEQKEKQLKHFDELIEKVKNPKAKQVLGKAKAKYEEAMMQLISSPIFNL